MEQKKVRTLTSQQVELNDTLERESIAELRDVEERLYRLIERWSAAADAGLSNILNQWELDAGTLLGAQLIIDNFCGCEDEGDKWRETRDERRAEERLLAAMAEIRSNRE